MGEDLILLFLNAYRTHFILVRLGVLGPGEDGILVGLNAAHLDMILHDFSLFQDLATELLILGFLVNKSK